MSCHHCLISRMALQQPLDIVADKLSVFHTQAGLTDCSWILFDSGACASCCPEWFASDYPTVPLKEECPLLKICLERHWKCLVEGLSDLIVGMVTP